jgi:signal recognition particle receptor subunit alpha
MLEEFTIFHEGGSVLWSQRFDSGISKGANPLNVLIGNVLLESRSGEKSFEHESHMMKWVRDTQLGLVFVCMWQKALQLLYIDELLDKVKKKFTAGFKERLASEDFGAAFEFELEGILRKCESEAMERKVDKSKAPRSFEDSEKWAQTKDGQNEIMHGIKAEKREGKRKDGRRNAKKNSLADDDDDDDDSDGERSDDGGDGPASGTVGDSEEMLSEEQRQANIQKRFGKKEKKKTKTPPQSPTESPGKKKKENREWAGTGARGKKEKDALDFSEKAPADADAVAKMDAHRAKQFGEAGKVELDGDYFNEEESDDDDEDVAAAGKKGGMFSMFTDLVNGKVLQRDDIEPVLRATRESLVEKNVAVDIADRLCESVCKSLEGKKMDSWTGVKGTVKTALEGELTRILTPKQSLDIVREIKHVRQQGRPYVIVFCGVNGVGKSTSLAKVCNWLLGNDLKVLIAACDTFRAGAVEQLKVHSRALGVEVFDQGYGKDAAGIAQEAVRHAKKPEVNADVVLVDTAGRMQDNAPLMVALAKLVALNKPDLSLFVGEALVGNDSVDQLKKFNQALADHADAAVGRTQYIDGIFLSKFDTVDDKIGAALSMVYETGQPIVFVGVGQTYKDIRRMNVQSIVRTLCK